MPQRPCQACSTRGPWVRLREPYFTDPAFNSTMGLTALGDQVFACPTCGLKYRREHEPATLFHDYDEYLFTRLEDAPPPPALGCQRCYGPEAALAWGAMRSRRLQSLVQESHFGVHLTECACGQRFVEVFTERIDWQEGQDEQDWIILPVLGPEEARLSSAGEADLQRVLEELGHSRRFLVRSRGGDGAMQAWWREGGLAIGRHD